MFQMSAIETYFRSFRIWCYHEGSLFQTDPSVAFWTESYWADHELGNPSVDSTLPLRRKPQRLGRTHQGQRVGPFQVKFCVACGDLVFYDWNWRHRYLICTSQPVVLLALPMRCDSCSLTSLFWRDWWKRAIQLGSVHHSRCKLTWFLA